ncbi:MAG: PKD domain-containing protein [Patescibacteria group bacterium]|nr:PKD domain-containing protein [Patescibacteria group bacterium]
MNPIKSKKFWFTILALILIGLLIYFLFLKNGNTQNGTIPSNGAIGERKDKNPPASQIKSPYSNTWQNKAFVIEALDEDLESGLDHNACEVKIVTYDNSKEYSTGWFKRKCNRNLSVSVGKGKMCGFEGKQACWIYIRSKDKDTNQHSPSLENKSIAYFNIDWTKPFVEKVFTVSTQQDQIYPINIEQDIKYNFKTNTSDDFKVIGCNLYINDQDKGMMLSSGSCGKECVLEKEFTPTQTGFYKIFAVCKDAAGNVSKSETIDAKTNLAPEITSCRVSPATGGTNTEFSFFVEVSNPDNDILNFSWSFNDNESSDIENPSHYYITSGTYKPQVIVSDDQGASDACVTAWVSVQN